MGIRVAAVEFTECDLCGAKAIAPKDWTLYEVYNYELQVTVTKYICPDCEKELSKTWLNK